MNCIAINNEPLSLNFIKDYCRKNSGINLVGTYTKTQDAAREIRRNNIDVIFLDLTMSNINGLEFIKYLPNPPLIVLTNLLPNYEIKGFEINEVQNLLRPLSFEALLKAANKTNTRLPLSGNYNFKNIFNSENEKFLFV